jgi:hypothetical protein
MRCAVLVFVMLALTGCGGGNRGGSPVELVAPKGYTGMVWLVLDPNGEDIRLVDGQYRITIPASGVLRVRSLQPMEQWHAFSARYDDGTPIPSDDGKGIAPEVVAIRGRWSGASKQGGRDYQYHKVFVGTAAERKLMPDRQDIPGIDK